MKFLRFYILNRLPITIGLIILGVVFHLFIDSVTAWLLYVAAAVSLTLYFLMGTMRLVQEAVMVGDVDLAGKYLRMIKFPQLLFKPIRVSYYALQSNLAMVSKDLDTAEDNILKSLNTKSSLAGDTRGMSLMQLGFIQMQKGNSKEARKNLLDAIKAGIPDKENLAAAYLQLCSIELTRNQNRIAKEYFRKAKSQNPKTPEIKDQIKTMEKHLARIPG